MTDINEAVKKLSRRVKHGKLKLKKVKLKTVVAKKGDSEVAKIIDDITSRIKRRKICKKARLTARTPIANLKRDVSNDVRSELEIKKGS